MKAKLAGALLCLMVLSGCQSTPSLPEWAKNSTNLSNTDFYYGLGVGETLSIAKKEAMSEITDNLMAEVAKKLAITDDFNLVNEEEHYQMSLDSELRIQTKSVILTGVEYPRFESAGGTYYVEAKISKEKVKSQALSEIQAINHQVSSVLHHKKHSDPLVWWLKYRDLDIKKMKEKLLLQLSVLNAVDPKESEKVGKESTDQVKKLGETIETVKNQLLVNIVTNGRERDDRLKEYLKNHLTSQGIKASENNKNITHKIKLSTNWAESYYDDVYYSTATVNLSVGPLNSKRTIASNEVIAYGSSVSNKTMSEKGAARHFEALMSEKGIWHILGLL